MDPQKEHLSELLSQLIADGERRHMAENLKTRKSDLWRAPIRLDVSIHTLRMAVRLLKN